jgi:L-Ala-D/L-Glu epimerase
MTNPTVIRSIAIEDLNIPLLEPFGIATGAQTQANNLLVTLELADGTRGYGEAAPFPAVNGETQASDARRHQAAAGEPVPTPFARWPSN